MVYNDNVLPRGSIELESGLEMITCPNADSTCLPHPAQVGLLQFSHVVFRHILILSLLGVVGIFGMAEVVGIFVIENQ